MNVHEMIMYILVGIFVILLFGYGIVLGDRWLRRKADRHDD
ncbi:hypothetical protein [Alicyclobacillus fodiniaquatilis]|uniref:Uncharacterized protein n=1 Tax=Alicyclobacillus fodiniaquatilis TaxID=1661150 RepID=A0ABW4JHG3_9BACL